MSHHAQPVSRSARHRLAFALASLGVVAGTVLTATSAEHALGADGNAHAMECDIVCTWPGDDPFSGLWPELSWPWPEERPTPVPDDSVIFPV